MGCWDRKDWLAGLLALSCAPGWAQATLESDAERLMDLSLQDLIDMPLITASRQSETRDRTPAHIMVVTREQIRERRYKNLADLLEDMPGIDFQRGTKSSQYNQFTVQGYVGPNKLRIMLDGIPIGHPAGGNFPVAENLALYAAKQVEILYGPAAALYGADAVSGVVNIITEAGSSGHGSDGAWASAGAGNFGSREASFMAGKKTGQGLSLSVGGHWQQSDRAALDRYYPKEFTKVDAKLGSQTIIPAAQREDYVGAISSRSLFARLDWDEKLTLGFFRHQFNSLTSTGDPPAMAIYQSGAQWQTTTDTVYGIWRFKPAADVDAQLAVDYSRMEVDPRAYYNNTNNGYQPGHSYVFGERTAIEQSLSWRLGERHAMQAGLGVQKYSGIETSSLTQPYDTGKSAGDQGQFYTNTTLARDIPDASSHNLSAYAQLQSQWSESLSTTAGLRLDRHSAYGSSANPRLGAVWKPQERHVFKLLYGEAFRAPSPEESLSAFGTFNGSQDAQGRYIGSNFRVPNLDLQPEKVRSLSLVWDWRPTPSLNLVSNLYHSRITDLIVNQDRAPNDATSIPGAILKTSETKGNAGHQAQTGLDVSAQWRFRLSSDWAGELWGSASWIHGRMQESDGVAWAIPYVASNKYKLGATLRWRDRFTITPRLYIVGDTTNGRKKAPGDALLPMQSCTASMQAPSRCVTPGYTRLDLHLGWHKLLDGKATLWLDVYNLLDKRHYAAGGGGSRTFWDMPQQPRTWVVSVDWRF